MKQLVILNGTSGSGKDLFVEIVQNWFISNEIHVPVKNISSVDKIREVAKLLGWNGIDRKDRDRKFLSDLKCLASDYSDHPFKYMQQRIEYAYDNSILFFHIREPFEIKKFISYYPEAKTILIRRPDLHIPNNMADQNVEAYTDWNYIIDNDSGKEEYVNKVITWIKNSLVEI